MADVLTPAKALAVNPLKESQPIGASLAFLGLARTMPLEHGARGCTSFNTLFFMRRLREPIALQTTAMDQTTTVLSAHDSVVEALATICARNAALPRAGFPVYDSYAATARHGLATEEHAARSSASPTARPINTPRASPRL